MIQIDHSIHLDDSPLSEEPLESLANEGNTRKRPRRRNSNIISAKVSRKDSFLVALNSIDTPGSNFRKGKRNSFLIASEILGFGQINQLFEEPKLEKKGEPVFYDTSKRSSTHAIGKISKRDSFLDTMESLELQNLNKKQRRVSQIFLSELLDFDSSNNLNNNKGLKKARKNSLLSLSSLSKKDSFTFSNESLIRSPKFSGKQRRVSQIFLSELLDFDSSNNFNNKKGLKKARRNSLLSLSSLSKKDSFTFSSERFTLSASTPSQKRNSFFITTDIPVVQNDQKRKRKVTQKNSFLTCFETDSPKNLNNQVSERPQKARRTSTLNTNFLWTSQPDSSTLNESVLKNKNANRYHNDQDCEPITQSASSNPSSKLISLCQAMRSSEESQTRIHDWDKKMGLRRSHSKTMRNSMRSRKELLKFCSNQIFMTL